MEELLIRKLHPSINNQITGINRTFHIACPCSYCTSSPRLFSLTLYIQPVPPLPTRLLAVLISIYANRTHYRANRTYKKCVKFLYLGPRCIDEEVISTRHLLALTSTRGIQYWRTAICWYISGNLFQLLQFKK